MKPVPLDDHDIMVLSPCEERVISGGDSYEDLPTARLVNRRDCPVVTRWTLTPEERQFIADGGDLYLTILTWHERSFFPIVPTAGVPCYTDAEQGTPIA